MLNILLFLWPHEHLAATRAGQIMVSPATGDPDSETIFLCPWLCTSRKEPQGTERSLILITIFYSHEFRFLQSKGNYGCYLKAIRFDRFV